MKSTPKPSPFDWKSSGKSLFTPAEKASMNHFAVTKSIERKEMKTYSKAGTK
jgi:hypothetical protein